MIARNPTTLVADHIALSIRSGKRLLISERNSFMTIQELHQRERRIWSLVNNSNFFLTDADSTLKLTPSAVEKLKFGLLHAMRLTNRLSDTEGSKHIVKTMTEDRFPVEGGLRNSWRHELLKMTAVGPTPLAEDVEHQAWTLEAFNEQVSIIHGLSTTELAWLVTLADGAKEGFERYTRTEFQESVARMIANMSFQEVLLRDGVSALWALIRGDATQQRQLQNRIHWIGCEVIWFEGVRIVSSDNVSELTVPDGLHLTIMRELRRRFVSEAVAKISRDQKSKGSNFDPKRIEDCWGTRDTWRMINKVIQENLGIKREWVRYSDLPKPGQVA